MDLHGLEMGLCDVVHIRSMAWFCGDPFDDVAQVGIAAITDRPQFASDATKVTSMLTNWSSDTTLNSSKVHVLD